MTSVKKVIIWFLLIASIGSAIYYLIQLYQADKKDTTPVSAVMFKTDTLVKIEYKDVIEYRDRFIYKTVYTNVTPSAEYGEKIPDTVFQKEMKYRDMILTLKKGRKDIEVFGWNEHDSLLKKYTFENVNNEFIAYADSGIIRIDEKWLNWKGIDAVIRGSFSISPKFLRDASGPFIEDRNYYAGLKTGILIGDKIGLDGGAYYDYLNAGWKLEAELSYKLK